MTAREKVILGVCGAVTLYGAWLFLFVPEPGQATQRKYDPVKLQARIENATAPALKKLAPVEEQKVRLLSLPWTQSPFLEREGTRSGRGGGALAANKTLLSYSGFAEVQGMRLAVINGLDYAEGDELELAGYFVAKILPGEVVIRQQTNSTEELDEIRIPIQEDPFTLTGKPGRR